MEVESNNIIIYVGINQLLFEYVTAESVLIKTMCNVIVTVMFTLLYCL